MTYGELFFVLSLSYLLMLVLVVRILWLSYKVETMVDVIHKLQIAWVMLYGKSPDEMRKKLEAIVHGPKISKTKR